MSVSRSTLAVALHPRVVLRVDEVASVAQLFVRSVTEPIANVGDDAAASRLGDLVVVRPQTFGINIEPPPRPSRLC